MKRECDHRADSQISDVTVFVVRVLRLGGVSG